MKTLAKNHVCNHFVIGEKHLKIYLSGPVVTRTFEKRAPGPSVQSRPTGMQAQKHEFS